MIKKTCCVSVGVDRVLANSSYGSVGRYGVERARVDDGPDVEKGQTEQENTKVHAVPESRQEGRS